MYGFGGVGLSEVQISISELSVVGGGGWWTRQTHFMVGPSQGPTKSMLQNTKVLSFSRENKVCCKIFIDIIPVATIPAAVPQIRLKSV